MASEAKRRANAKYDAAHTKQVSMKLNVNTDADIIERLESVPAVQTYIKDLIRRDIKNGRNLVGH